MTSEIMQHFEKTAAEKAKIRLVINNSKRYIKRGVLKSDIVNDIAEDLGISIDKAAVFFDENVLP